MMTTVSEIRRARLAAITSDSIGVEAAAKVRTSTLITQATLANSAGSNRPSYSKSAVAGHQQRCGVGALTAIRSLPVRRGRSRLSSIAAIGALAGRQSGDRNAAAERDGPRADDRHRDFEYEGRFDPALFASVA